MRSPGSLHEMPVALDFRWSRPREIVLVHGGKESDLAPFLDVVRSGFRPHGVLVRLPEARVESLAERLPIVRGKRSGPRRITAYVCERGVCALPTSDPEVFREQLERPLDEPGTPKKTGSKGSSEIDPT